jgi:hypothetical protein
MELGRNKGYECELNKAELHIDLKLKLGIFGAFMPATDDAAKRLGKKTIHSSSLVKGIKIETIESVI